MEIGTSKSRHNPIELRNKSRLIELNRMNGNQVEPMDIEQMRHNKHLEMLSNKKESIHNPF